VRDYKVVALTALIQRLGHTIAKGVGLSDLSKSRNLASFLYLVPNRVRHELHIIGNPKTVHFPNHLTKDEIFIILLFQ
jgi:hypothetical protein